MKKSDMPAHWACPEQVLSTAQTFVKTVIQNQTLELFAMEIFNFQFPLNVQTRIALITLHVEKMESVLRLVRKADFVISIKQFPIYNISECLMDVDCPDQLLCGNEKVCVEQPCLNCAENAYCEISNHTGICICHNRYAGDPYQEGCSGNKHSYL